MSTLKVNTVQHNTSGFNNVVQFTDGAGTQNGTLCRAWVNFNGQGTVAIRADFNVNTVGDNGTGDYTVNFSSAIGNTTYSVVAGNSSTNTDLTGTSGFTEIGNLASGNYRLHFIERPTGSTNDCGLMMSAVFS